MLKLDPRDNVLIALQNLRQGESINFSGRTYVLATDVHAKHKFSTEDLATRSTVTELLSFPFDFIFFTGSTNVRKIVMPTRLTRKLMGAIAGHLRADPERQPQHRKRQALPSRWIPTAFGYERTPRPACGQNRDPWKRCPSRHQNVFRLQKILPTHTFQRIP